MGAREAQARVGLGKDGKCESIKGGLPWHNSTVSVWRARTRCGTEAWRRTPKSR